MRWMDGWRVRRRSIITNPYTHQPQNDDLGPASESIHEMGGRVESPQTAVFVNGGLYTHYEGIIEVRNPVSVLCMQIVSKINIWLKPFVSDPFVCPDAIGYFLSFWSSWSSIYLIDTVTAKSFKTLRNKVIENLIKTCILKVCSEPVQFWRENITAVKRF